MNVSVSLSMGATKHPVTPAAPHCHLPPQGAVTANPHHPPQVLYPPPYTQSCSFPPQQRKWRSSGGAQVPQQHPTDPRFVSEHLVAPWHCSEHLTTLSHTIMDLLSTTSSPRAAKIPGQILVCHKPHPAWDQGSAFLTSVLLLPRPALSEGP